MTPDRTTPETSRDLVGQTLASETMVPKGWPLGPYYLLAIGIDSYLHWPPLTTARAGAEVLRDTLIGEFGFEAGNCRLLLNQEATGAAIIAALRLLARTLPPLPVLVCV